MQTKHWIPLTAHKFDPGDGSRPPYDLGTVCSCGEALTHASHVTSMIGAAVIDFLQSSGDGYVTTQAVIMLASGGIVTRSLDGMNVKLIAAAPPGADFAVDPYDQSPILPPPPRPRRPARKPQATR